MLEKIVRRFDRAIPVAGSLVDGYRVLGGVDNLESIRSSLTDYVVLRGLRAFPTRGFRGKRSFYAADDWNRVEQLTRRIRTSMTNSPLIIVIERRGPYVLEGAHRMAAMVDLGASAVPALVVLDLEDWRGKQ